MLFDHPRLLQKKRDGNISDHGLVAGAADRGATASVDPSALPRSDWWMGHNRSQFVTVTVPIPTHELEPNALESARKISPRPPFCLPNFNPLTSDSAVTRL